MKALIVIALTITSGLLAGVFRDSQLEEVIERSFRYSPVKGLAVSVVDKTGTRVSTVLGYANNTQPMDANSPVFIGSVSKTFTALAIIRLNDMGLVNLDDKVSKYLEGFEGKNELTINHLLHHHSGHSQEAGYDHDVEFNGAYRNIRPAMDPGIEGIYSSFNYMLLGLIIERVTNKPYSVFMEEDVFTPLGLHQTFIPNPSQGSEMIGYCLLYGIPIKSRQMDYGKYVIPAGYIVTTLNDLNRYALFLLSEGKVYNGSDTLQFISASSASSLFRPFGGGEYGFGKAWGVGKVNGLKTYSHEGMTKISNASISILPDLNTVVVVISNTNSGPFFSISGELSAALINHLSKQPPGNKIIWEYIIKVVIGLGLLKVFFDVFYKTLKWIRQGKPYRPRLRIRRIPAYISEMMPLLVLFGLPYVIHVPISMLLRIMPDLGYAILISGVLSIALVFFKLVEVETIAESETKNHHS